MYPSRFSYEAPTSIDEAVELLRLGAGEAKVLAGGQSLLPMMKLRFASPGTLIDINNIPDLAYHRADADGTYRIGALCRHAHLEKANGLAEIQPTIAAAAPLVADPIVRTRGTFVGSVCHADPQGDWASVMIALGGSVVAQGPDGSRSIPVSDFVSGPFQTVLGFDELAIEAVVPAPVGDRAGGYLKLERRVGDFATAGVAVSIERSGSSVARAGIGLTGVGSSTIDASDAAASLVGGNLTDDEIARAAELAASASRPRSDHRGSADYKRHIVATFVTRLLSNLQLTNQEAA
ncbi:MAG: xanthine dehydrogenase family protein subunit M [Actinomycetota bacterium]|jgi:carbon-monoxide dehydrogenase medium subunit|nr:xanthine dehydrogenase family protein subunit M [Actinomycetota bacterium]